jgi:hypothetical protein
MQKNIAAVHLFQIVFGKNLKASFTFIVNFSYQPAAKRRKNVWHRSFPFF